MIETGVVLQDLRERLWKGELLHSVRIEFPAPLVQIQRSEMQVELHIIKAEDPAARWTPAHHQYVSAAREYNTDQSHTSIL